MIVNIVFSRPLFGFQSRNRLASKSHLYSLYAISLKMSQYVASVPSDGQVKPEIQHYYERFYRVSDTPEDHEAYADMFTSDAKLVMGPNVAQGKESTSSAAST